MLGAKNLIRKITYSLPETKYCHGPFHTKYPCGFHWVNHTVGIYAEFTYPSVPPDQQAAIYACAYAAGVAAYPTLAGAVASCAAGPACIKAITLAIPVSNSILRETFFKCIREASGLPNSVKGQCNIGLT
ncbi:hypothetical protein ACT7DQ_27450 [Bacillus cereus]